MINTIAKTLVFIYTILSLLGLAWALAVFLQFTDWGWKEPRQDLGAAIPSEYDKATASAKLADRGRNLVLATVAPAQTALAQAQSYFPKNHLYYVAELNRLQSAAGPIDVKMIKPGMPLDTPGKRVGRPVLEGKVDDVDKSYTEYLKEIKKVQGDVEEVENEVRQVLEKTKGITFQLTGKDDTGKQVQPGLYDLIDAEYKAQEAAKFEKEYLQPQWAQALEQARLFTLRRSGLEYTLSRLQQAGKKKR